MNGAILVAGGGALGALARYAVGLMGLRLFGAAFPYGTLAVNAIGGLAMGAVFILIGDRKELMLLLATGVLGGFTTFSSYSLEVVRMFERGDLVTAVSYALGSVIIACAGVYLGMSVARGLA